MYSLLRFLLMALVSVAGWMAIGLGVGCLLHWLVPAIDLGMATLIGVVTLGGLLSVAQPDVDTGGPLRTRRQRTA